MTVSIARISGANPVFEDSELVFGLVAPVGTNFEKFQHLLERCLRRFDYRVNAVRLSDLINNFEVELSVEHTAASAEGRRLDRMMHAGNYLRLTSERGEFLALAAAKQIRARRPAQGVLPRTAHVIRSLKHPRRGSGTAQDLRSWLLSYRRYRRGGTTTAVSAR